MGGVRLMEYIVENHEVLSVEEVVTTKQTAIVKKHYTFVKHIKAEVSNNIITFRWETWEEESLPFEPVEVEISGELIETATLTLEEPELELTGEGQIIVKTLNEKVKNVELVVEL